MPAYAQNGQGGSRMQHRQSDPLAQGQVAPFTQPGGDSLPQHGQGGQFAPKQGDPVPQNGQSPRPAGIDVGSQTLTGRKMNNPSWTNQDSHLRLELPEGRLLMAVFDGHGQEGHKISNITREVFAKTAMAWAADGSSAANHEKKKGAKGLLAHFTPSRFKGKPESPDEPLLRHLFAETEAALQAYPGLCQWSGTTASCAIIDRVAGQVTLANIGDSTLVVVDGSGTIAHASKEHKFDDEAEKRIRASGGEVRVVGGGARLYAKGSEVPGLALSRALGDFEAKKVGLSAEPFISYPLPFTAGHILIIASDGVWDFTTQPQAAETARSMPAEAAANSLVYGARQRWESQAPQNIDDITALVVKMEA